MEKVQVVNRHFYKGKGEYVGRGTPLGNKHNTGNRTKDIADFKKDLWKEMQDSNSDMMKELFRLLKLWKSKKELILICSCKPKACHADVVAKALNWMKSQEYLI